MMFDESYDVSYRWREEEDPCECTWNYNPTLGYSEKEQCGWCYEEEERYEAKRQREIEAENKRKRKALLEEFCLRHLRNIHGIDYVEEMLFAEWRQRHSSVLVVNGVNEAIWKLDGISLQADFVPKLKPILNYFLESNGEVSTHIHNYFRIQQRCRSILNQEALAELHPKCREILSLELKPQYSEATALRNFLDAAMHTEDTLCVIKKLFEYVQTIGPFLAENPALLNSMVAKVAVFKADPHAVSIRDTLLSAENFLRELS